MLQQNKKTRQGITSPGVTFSGIGLGGFQALPAIL
jgi:hypothetical protein